MRQGIGCGARSVPYVEDYPLSFRKNIIDAVVYIHLVSYVLQSNVNFIIRQLVSSMKSRVADHVGPPVSTTVSDEPPLEDRGGFVTKFAHCTRVFNYPN